MNFPFSQELILENDRARLRPLLIADQDNLLDIATADNTLLQYSPMPVFNKELLTQYIAKAVHDREHNTRYPFIIFDKRQNAYAGSTSFLNISNVNSKVEIGGTWLGPSFQKTGLNRSCKLLLLTFVFETLEAERVEFKTDERNAASRKAIEAIGGQFEGILRRDTLMYDGFRRSTTYYGILREEWPEIKSKLEKVKI